MTNPAIILIAAYFVVMLALMLAAQPYRRELRELVRTLEGECTCAEADKEFLEGVRTTLFSIRVAPVLVLVFLVGLLASLDGLMRQCDDFEHDNPNLTHDARLDRLLDLHMAVAAANNPLFGAVAYVLRILFRLKILAWQKRRPLPRAVSFVPSLAGARFS